MCPNVYEGKEASRVCPGIVETPHPKPSSCRFVVSYLDDNGAEVFVSKGLGKTFMSFRKSESGMGLRRVKTKRLPERKDFDTAQVDLNAYAKEKGWRCKT
jgi:hypothetical protein